MPRLNSPTRSKFYQVESVLLSRIRGRAYRAGDCIPSEQSLVDELAVSRGTVRRAIQNLVRDGVLEPRAGFGHVVRSRARKLTIGLLFGNMRFQSFQRLMLEAFAEALPARGFRNRLYIARFVDHTHVVDHTQLVKDLQRRHLGGMLTVSWRSIDSARDKKLAKLMRTMDVPCVSIAGSDIPNAVSEDNYGLVASGTQYFLDRGIQKIALMYPTPVDHLEDLRVLRRAYQETLAKAGIPFDPSLVCVAPTLGERAGYEAFGQWWQAGHRADAMVITDDVTAKGAISATVDLGVAIPDDLQLAAMALRDSDMFFLRPFVRLEIDPRQLAREAISRMTELIRRPDAVLDSIQLPIRIVEPHNTDVERSPLCRGSQ